MTTGNPVRREITDILSPKWRYDEREQAGKPLNILIVGGSLGAKALNERLPPALKQLQVPLNIFHQCGQQQVEATQALYADAPANLTVQVLPFIEDMAKAYSEADLIICRAGALTVTEVATAGVAAVLYRFLLQWMTIKLQCQISGRCRCCKICQQSTMTPEVLNQLFTTLMNRQLLTEMAVKARQHAQPNATQHVVDLIQNVIGFTMSPTTAANQAKTD